MPLPPVRVVVYGPPTGRPFGTENIKNTSIQFLSDNYNDGNNMLNRWGNVIKAKIKDVDSFLNTQYPSDPPETLRLFLGAEWVFRKKNVIETDFEINADNNITLNYIPPISRKEAVALVQKMMIESKKAPLKNWLLIPGTIYWGEQGENSKYETYNMIPAIYNGQLLSLLHKQIEADTWARKENWGINASSDAQKLQNAIDISEQLIKQITGKKNVNNRGFFQCKNIRFATEICGDHSSTVSRVMSEFKNDLRPKITTQLAGIVNDSFVISNINNENSDNLRTLINNTFVDIHLLVSCGAGIASHKIGARTGGYFIQADGSVSNEFDSWDEKVYSIKLKKIMDVISPVNRNFQINSTFQSLDSKFYKRVFPTGSTDIYNRMFIGESLLNLNPAPTTTAVTQTLTT